MSKTRDKYISMRVDEGIYNEVKKERNRLARQYLITCLAWSRT